MHPIQNSARLQSTLKKIDDVSNSIANLQNDLRDIENNAVDINIEMIGINTPSHNYHEIYVDDDTRTDGFRLAYAAFKAEICIALKHKLTEERDELISYLNELTTEYQKLVNNHA